MNLLCAPLDSMIQIFGTYMRTSFKTKTNSGLTYKYSRRILSINMRINYSLLTPLCCDRGNE